MKRHLALLAQVATTLALSGCATPYIDDSYRSVAQDSRAQFLVIHYTAIDFPKSMQVLVQGGRVSSHYLVRDDPPEIYRLVDENRRSWHAGISSWQGHTALNASSIGIEIVNIGYTKNPDGTLSWQDYPPGQIEAVVALVKKIVKEHNIKPDRIVGHNEIAPSRKQDPGPKFPWKRLADEGLIIWPDANKVAEKLPVFEQLVPDVMWFQDRLIKHGYALATTGLMDEITLNALTAFQMKYRPRKHDGQPDAETAAMLEILTTPK